MVIIHVRVHGHIASLLPEGKTEYEFELDEPMSVSAFLQEHLSINPLVFASIVVNGKAITRDFVLDDDCEILLVSPIAGG